MYLDNSMLVEGLENDCVGWSLCAIVFGRGRASEVEIYGMLLSRKSVAVDGLPNTGGLVMRVFGYCDRLVIIPTNRA